MLLFYSIDVKVSTFLMIAYQTFSFYNLKKKNYQIGSFLEGAVIFAFIIFVLTNLYVQKTLRNFLVINIQIENLYKEQTVIFENLSDGAIIH